MAAVAATLGAQAADLEAPVYKAAPAAEGRFYFWADDSWQSVRLPSYALGLHNYLASGFRDAGPLQSFDPRASGNGVRGAIGYAFAPGMLPAAFGTNVRMELGGSYVRASAAQSAVASGGGEPVNLAGAASFFAFNCFGLFFSCATASSLATDYRAWQVYGKFASDFRSGVVTVTPSVALVGGDSRNNQSLQQALSQFKAGGTLMNTGGYAANSLLDWTDFGARVGLDGRLELSDWMSLCAGGYIGVMERHVSLNGTDSFISSAGVAAVPPSTIASTATTAAFVANGEIGLEAHVHPKLALKAFAGLNYDGRVPGIFAPGFAGSFKAPTPIPAGTFYAVETSYYAGGGVRIGF
jgi:hypothetical protein